MSLRVTEADYETLRAKTGTLPTTGSPSPSPPRNKYKAVRKEVDGHVFDSKAEAWHYLSLKLQVRMGEIEHLVLQPTFRICLNGVHICDYRADFSYYRNGAFVVEDVKGVRTPVYQLKKKLIEALSPIRIVEITRTK
jgi:Protein of unknown function (DUF1064)